jgi:heat shock protein HslJ
MSRAVRAVASLMLIAACSSSATTIDPAHLQGYWVLESFEVDGVANVVELGVNTARIPWVVMIGDVLEGSGGCNDFTGFESPPYWVEGARLLFGDIMFTAALCIRDGSESVMAAELAMLDALWRSPEGVVVESGDAEMVWVAGDTRLVFSKSDGPPSPPPLPPETGIGRLDCLPGVMIRQSIPDFGSDGEQILRAVPEVATVVSQPPDWWWGYDSNARVIAAVAKGDIVPIVYELFTCANAPPDE